MIVQVETPQEASAVRRNRVGMLQAGLAAGLALTFSRAVGPAAASKRTKRLKTKRCKKQVQPCIDSLTAACEGKADCLENLICCDRFADCNAAGALSCIFSNAN